MKRYIYIFVSRKTFGKNFSGKYSQKLLDDSKTSATDGHKTSSKRVIQNMAEETGYLIGNKITNKITKNSLQDNSQIEEKLLENTEKDIYP